MTGKTHIAVGLAAALALTNPSGAEELLAAVIGGCVGGVISDVDSPSSTRRLETTIAQFVAVAVTLEALVADHAMGTGLCQAIAGNARTTLIPGLTIFSLLTLAGVFSPHRSLTHSLAALVLWTVSVWLVCAPIAAAFGVGLASHLVLDLLNRQPVRPLYPLRVGLSLCLYRADGVANNVLFACGIAVSAALLVAHGASLL